ncbi:flagellar filament capping protein FliD [Solemya velesiana gill symbiont]|uniref:Flagellar hook-associated protein 2 n=1 Tax=Solemya velesiana gill symbiont TaxID=1918948 RepID=A0A1T2KY32_9GAMM|nr:flagellar filament capping protein FliD [Solemya velesiana gill symbiont]OOZ37721.1 hypothetical protein BOW51_00885 [Solemya velesiana gill symbiont]
MPIGMPGIGSGLDLGTVIDQLMAIERRPLDRLLQQQQEVETQISAYGRLSSAVTSFQLSLSPLRFQTAFLPKTATSSNESVATATATAGVATSSYDLVVTDLAQAHKLASYRYTDSAEEVGTGTITLEVNGSSTSITVDSSSNTLAGLRDAINDDANNPGISASLINESGGTRLILQSDETGEDSEITVTCSGDGSGDADNVGLSKLFYVDAGDPAAAEEVTAAQNAAGTIDGFAFTSASNTVSGVVENLTFTVKSAGSSTLSVEKDTASIKSAIQNFVDKYNSLHSVIQSERAADLSGDTSLNFIEMALSGVLNESTGGTLGSLAEIGMSRDRYGVMSIDSEVFDSVLENRFDDVVSLFTDETTGVANRLYDIAGAMLDESGVIGSRQTSLDDRKSFLQIDELRLQSILDATEERLVRQFAELDQLVASFQGISDYLSNNLSSLNR